MCGCFRRKKGMNSFMKDSFNPAYSFVPNEEKVLEFWEQNKSFEALRKKNAKGKKYRFIDGPITANNPMGVHHAWGRTLKDVFLRYKAMNGYQSHYRNGFDGQGLWVEVEVEKELGFNSKKILKFTDWTSSPKNVSNGYSVSVR